MNSIISKILVEDFFLCNVERELIYKMANKALDSGGTFSINQELIDNEWFIVYHIILTGEA